MSVPLTLNGMTVRLKVVLVSPDGTKVEVLDATYKDPFTQNYVFFLDSMLSWPAWAGTGGVPMTNAKSVGRYFWSPGTLFASPLASLCVVNCPNTNLLSGTYAVTVPGFWLYSTPFTSPVNWAGSYYGYLISSLNYQTPTISPSAGNIPPTPFGGTASFTINQQIVNPTSNIYTVYSAALVAAIYNAGNSSPDLFDIAYFNFSPAVSLSPGVTMFITATFSIPT
jgi:hypothetical protein